MIKYKYYCDHCGKPIELLHSHKIELNNMVDKYLCEDCYRTVHNFIDGNIINGPKGKVSTIVCDKCGIEISKDDMASAAISIEYTAGDLDDMYAERDLCVQCRIELENRIDDFFA